MDVKMDEMKYTNATSIVQFTCELNGILLLWQFKPTISNQHIKMTFESTFEMGTEDRRAQLVDTFLSPKLPIYSSFACTLNVHEIGEPEVAKGSSSQFFCHSSSLYRARRPHQLQSSRRQLVNVTGVCVVWEIFALVGWASVCVCAMCAFAPYVR